MIGRIPVNRVVRLVYNTGSYPAVAGEGGNEKGEGTEWQEGSSILAKT
jgi:hypothetical protein